MAHGSWPASVLDCLRYVSFFFNCTHIALNTLPLPALVDYSVAQRFAYSAIKFQDGAHYVVTDLSQVPVEANKKLRR